MVPHKSADRFVPGSFRLRRIRVRSRIAFERRIAVRVLSSPAGRVRRGGIGRVVGGDLTVKGPILPGRGRKMASRRPLSSPQIPLAPSRRWPIREAGCGRSASRPPLLRYCNITGLAAPPSSRRFRVPLAMYCNYALILIVPRGGKKFLAGDARVIFVQHMSGNRALAGVKGLVLHCLEGSLR